MRCLLLLAAGISIAGCARADYAEGRRHWLGLSAGAQPGWAVKQVVEKRHGTTLIGEDGSVCRTSEERAQRVEPGDWISCDWTVEGETEEAGVGEAVSANVNQSQN